MSISQQGKTSKLLCVHGGEKSWPLNKSLMKGIHAGPPSRPILSVMSIVD